MKILPVRGGRSMRTDRRIDMTKLVIASCLRKRQRTEGAETENKTEIGKEN